MGFSGLVSFELRHGPLCVCSCMSVAWQVSDLGAVLHMVGGTAASFMIFFLPGMMLINAAIVKRSNQVQALLPSCQPKTCDECEELLPSCLSLQVPPCQSGVPRTAQFFHLQPYLFQYCYGSQDLPPRPPYPRLPAPHIPTVARSFSLNSSCTRVQG